MQGPILSQFLHLCMVQNKVPKLLIQGLRKMNVLGCCVLTVYLHTKTFMCYVSKHLRITGINWICILVNVRISVIICNYMYQDVKSPHLSNPHQIIHPCTTPCTTHAPTHAQPSLLINQIHNPTPPNLYPSALHDTAAILKSDISKDTNIEYSQLKVYERGGSIRPKVSA